MSGNKTIGSVKSYFNSFVCLRLKSVQDYRKKIELFSATFRNNTLSEYLKQEAKKDDDEGKTCVYLILDPTKEKIVCFFSIKCGSVYDTDEVDDTLRSLETNDLKLVNDLESALSQNLSLYTEMCKLYREIHPNGSMLIQIAERRHASKKDETASSCIDVKNVHSAVEIQHFCKCDDYADYVSIPEEYKDIPFGFGLFWQKIVPKVKEVSNLIGCEYLYLFAADRSDDSERHLVNYYVNSLHFNEAEDLALTIARPEDDKRCWGLVQKISCLDIERRDAWESVSDFSDKF